MADLKDGESVEVQGSAAKPYVLKNTGGVYSCSCPAWRNQSVAIERRTCKHLRKLRGEEAEAKRIADATGGDAGATAATPRAAKGSGTGSRAVSKETAPPLLLAQPWDNALDVEGWWMSEKLDGVRAYWDGRRLVSRLGNEFHAPEWFLQGLPAVPLDGELWMARKAFQRTVSVVRRQDKGPQWRDIQYLVFDAPSATGPFEERIEAIETHVREAGLEHVVAHPQRRCDGVDSLREELSRVEALGGEGLMLRQPGSQYQVGRSSTLLKVKTFHDSEAEVLGHVPGKGRHQGRLGALQVRLSDGTEFSVGTGFSDADRESPPPVGSVITFRYQELSDGGVPRFPSYVRPRPRSGE